MHCAKVLGDALFGLALPFLFYPVRNQAKNVIALLEGAPGRELDFEAVTAIGIVSFCWGGTVWLLRRAFQKDPDV